MSNNDDFPENDGADKTLLRPRPGGRRASGPAMPAPESYAPDHTQLQRASVEPSAQRPSAAAPGQSQPIGAASSFASGRQVSVPSIDALGSVGASKLARAAAPLLVLTSQLRSSPSHADINTLHRQVIERVQKFEAEASAGGVMQEQLVPARYALCAALDEAVLSTPWGSQSIWSTHSLLATFHGETWGGEKFFQILERIQLDAARNLDLLELMYLCLALGFEGKYKIQERGQVQLAHVQEDLYRLIRRQRGEFERQLSPHWRGIDDRRNALVRFVPLWVVASLLVAVLLGSFLTFRIGLANATQPIDAALSGIGLPDLSRMQGVSVPAAQRLKPLLAGPEAQGLLDATEQGSVTIVTLRGDNLFSSGSTEVNEQYISVLQQIGEALNQVSGSVHVIGHTDNVPIRSFRFQSNWELSRERAIDVAEILSQSMTVPTRLIPQGVADTQPLTGNDTAAGRALNRRVEIVHTAQSEAQ